MSTSVLKTAVLATLFTFLMILDKPYYVQNLSPCLIAGLYLLWGERQLIFQRNASSFTTFGEGLLQ